MSTHYELQFPDPAMSGPQVLNAARRDALYAEALKLTRGDPSADNETIPAGYTYLLQFASHDLRQCGFP